MEYNPEMRVSDEILQEFLMKHKNDGCLGDCLTSCMLLELAAYRKAEAEGLPYKAGDTVWCIERDEEEDAEVTGFIYVAHNDECVIASPRPYGYEGTISEHLIEESAEDYGCEVMVFPLSDVFPAREDADAALRKEGEG